MKTEKKVFETNNMNELIEIENVLNNLCIEYEARPKSSTMLNNFLNLFLYNVLSFGIDRKNEIMCIYVKEQDFNNTNEAIQKYKISNL